MSESITAVTFSEIPYTWKVPGNYMEVKPAVNASAVLPFPAYGLIMGQLLSTGQALAGYTYRINSGPQANALFGLGSQLAKMCWKWLKNNPYTPVDAVGISDATGSAKAVGTVTISGTATAAGTLAMYFGGLRVPVAVNLGDTAAMVAANLYVALVQQSAPGFEPLPCLVPSYTGGMAAVTLTCAHGGLLGNSIDIRFNANKGEQTPPGLVVAVAAMAGGATNPTTAVSAALATISTWYTDVAFAWTDTTNTGAFQSWLTGRYGAMQKLDVQGYVGFSATYGTVLGYTLNCQFLTDLPIQNSMTPPWEIAAAAGGACCYQLAQTPSLQLKTVPLKGVVKPADADVWTLTEKEALLLAGHSTYYADLSGNMYLERVVTTYRTDPNGVPSTSWFDIMTPKVCTRVRWDWDNYIAALFPRNHLCQDGTIAAQFDPYAVTPRVLSAAWKARSAVYEANGWIQNSAATAANSTFVIDANDGNRVDARQQISVMGNLMVLAGSLEFISP